MSIISSGSTEIKSSGLFRYTGVFRLALPITTTVVPLVAFKRRPNMETTVCCIQDVDITSDANIIFEIRTDASLTGANFGTPPGYNGTTDTVLRPDVAATAVANGTLLYNALVPPGVYSPLHIDPFVQGVSAKFYFQDVTNMVLCARAVSGTATVSALFRIREEW